MIITAKIRVAERRKKVAFNKRFVIYWPNDLADAASSQIMSDKGQMVISDVGFKGCVQISVGGIWFAI